MGLRSRPLHLHVVKPGNPSLMEPSQGRNDNHAEHYCYDNQRCLSSTISEHKTKQGISITSIRLARKACDEGSPPPAGRSLGCMNLCPPPWRLMDKGGIQVGHGYLLRCERSKGHTELENPARRPIAGVYAIKYRELGMVLTRTTATVQVATCGHGFRSF